jgi:hypothetical protein
MRRDIATFGSGVLITLLSQEIVHWLRGSMFDWPFFGLVLGLLFLLGQQLLSQSYRRTRLTLTCLGLVVMVSFGAARVWTTIHSSTSRVNATASPSS